MGLGRVWRGQVLPEQGCWEVLVGISRLGWDSAQPGAAGSHPNPTTSKGPSAAEMP